MNNLKLVKMWPTTYKRLIITRTPLKPEVVGKPAYNGLLERGRGLRVDSGPSDLWLWIRALFARVLTIVSGWHSGFGHQTYLHIIMSWDILLSYSDKLKWKKKLNNQIRFSREHKKVGIYAVQLFKI